MAPVTASEARQSMQSGGMDCFTAFAMTGMGVPDVVGVHGQEHSDAAIAVTVIWFKDR